MFGEILDFDQPVIDDQGRIAFYAELRTGGSVTISNRRGLWSDRTGTLQLVARQGTQAPGLPVGAQYSTFGTPVLNAAGQIAFRATLSTGSGGVVSGNNDGIWSDRGGATTLLFREGDTAPSGGSTESPRFQLFDDPVINRHGQIAFTGRVQSGMSSLPGGDDSGLWVERGGGLELVVREGDPVPGAPAGAVFDDLAGVTGSPFVFNARGQVAFLGEMKVGLGGVTFGDREGIWATDLAGKLRLIVRVGDRLKVAPGDFREIRALQFVAGTGPGISTGNEDGRPSGFNERGEVAFAAEFTDFSAGVFVSSLVVPEPSSATLMLLASVVSLSRGSYKWILIASASLRQ